MADKPDVVYLDNNATTELSQDVSSVVMDIVLHNVYGNPNSQHGFGIKTRTLIDAARYGVAQSLGCRSDEVIFTSGGTEANNLAMRGIYGIPATQELVISAAEHSSVFNTAEHLAGDNVRMIPLYPDGSLNLDWADRLITEDLSMVSVMLANNETGAIFPIKEIVKIAHKRGVLVHCDAVQAYGKIGVNVQDLGVDLLSISGHKAHALPGVGALYVRKGVLLHPSITGGDQEYSLRAGTENYIGIVSMGAAANEITRRGGGLEPGLRDAFETGILKRVPDIIVNAKNVPRVPNTSSVTFKGIHALSMLTALSEEGVFASAGSACSSGSVKPSRVLSSMGLSEDDAVSTVRFSFSSMSKMIDAAIAIESCVKCAKTLRNSGAVK